MSMIAKNEIKITFDVIFTADKKGRGYTGYLAQFPDLIAQGTTKEEVELNLLSSLKDILDHQKGQAFFTKSEFTETESMNLVFA